MSDALRVVNLRGWPGLATQRPLSPLPTNSPSLGERMAVVLVAAAEAGATPERYGLGAYLVTVGPSIISGGIVVPNHLNRDARRSITRWARSHPLITTTGPMPWAVVTLAQFYDPFTPGEFTRRAYAGADFCIGADLGRVFGLAADHSGPRRGENAKEWEVWLPGWGRQHPDGRWKRCSPHRPPLQLSARRVGWKVEFGPCGTINGRPAGKRVRSGLWRGAFVDVLSLAYALDADRIASFAEHGAQFGLELDELPLTVPMNATGAKQVAAAVTAVHALAVALDRRATEWFTTSSDRSEGRTGLNLSRVASPGAIAAQIPARFRTNPPLGGFDLTDEEHRAWAETFHGGWCDLDRRLAGVPFPVVSADVSSCFPLVANRLGWWELLCAEYLERVDVTAQLLSLCEMVTSEPAAVLDAQIFAAMGLTIADVLPDGEPWPVEVNDERRPDGRMEVVSTYSPDRALRFAWPDVVASAARAQRRLKILRATRLVPVGRQGQIRQRLPLLPGLVLDAERDPVLALMERRQRAKADGDLLLAAELRVVSNSLVFGITARFDETWNRIRGHRVIGERPGPWTFLPIASSISAGARLLLAVLDRLVIDTGGIVVYRDTDSSLIPASPTGGAVALPDAELIPVLAWDQVDDILATFEALSPATGWGLWNSERGTAEAPLWAIGYGPKRHVEYVETGQGIELVEHTEAQLGATSADPPALVGRAQNGTRMWSGAAVQREVAHTRARIDESEAIRPSAPWDKSQRLPTPVLQRFEVKTPKAARGLPGALGPRPGTRYVAGLPSPLIRDVHGMAVALDPGGDLSDWQQLEWVNRRTGTAVRVTTDPADLGAILLDTLAAKAAHWSAPSSAEPIDCVVVDPFLLRIVGRVSGVIDANVDGVDGDLSVHRPEYADAQRAEAVSKLARAIGPRSFSRRTGISLKAAERAALGQPISAANVAKALRSLRLASGRCCPIDGHPVADRPNALYCSDRCKDRAYRLRQKQRTRSPKEPGTSPGGREEGK